MSVRLFISRGEKVSNYRFAAEPTQPVGPIHRRLLQTLTEFAANFADESHGWNGHRAPPILRKIPLSNIVRPPPAALQQRPH
jgi:hypothetical protein